MELEKRQEDKRRIRLVVAYDGTNYHGWQVQKNGITIESELNRALLELTGEEIQVIGASRTDAGVHALGNIAVFDTLSPIPAGKFCYALNARLPEDVRVIKSDEVPADWHPRKRESRKTYEYRISIGEIQQPVKRLYAYHVYRKLDLEAMKAAAKFLVGEHDFKSFCQENAQVESTVRTLYEVTIMQEELQDAASLTAGEADGGNANGSNANGSNANGGELILRVTGNGFLYNMVRIIVGTLLEVGYGRFTPEDVARILEAKDRAAAGPTAPARGLTLVKYEFPEE